MMVGLSSFLQTYVQVTPVMRPTAGFANTLKAAGLKSRSYAPVHPGHLSTIETVTDFPPLDARDFSHRGMYLIADSTY